MKTKKIPYYLLVGSLTVGASLILGFLSFTGAMALWPIVAVASVFFVLSVAYEGEIYLQNIKGALNKLGFKDNFMHRKLARQYLAEYAPSYPNDNDPEFFHNYMKMLELREQYKRKGRLNSKDRKHQQALKKLIKKTEKQFTVLLFDQKKPQTPFEVELVEWLKTHQQCEWLIKAKNRQYHYYISAIFAGIAGLSMSFGTTYLLLGAFSTIPIILTASPILLTVGITAASLIAGAAYALLTFNTITDIIDNDTVKNWFKKLKQNIVEKPSLRSIMVSTVAIVLLTLAVALTICTAGTWWTVIKKTPPLFKWMSKIPKSILMIFPVINGAAALSFNFENTSESFDMVNDMLDHKPAKPWFQRLKDTWHNLLKSENFWQRLNPFRLILKLTLTPLRILLFLGHLVSIALTSDRLPGVPQIVSFLVGFICEGFEDAHYFLVFDAHPSPAHSKADILKAHLSDDKHDHSNDLPTRLLNLLFTPIHYLAALWDYGVSNNHNWQQSSRKFNLSDKIDDDKKIDDVTIPSSQRLSKLGISALRSHVETALSSDTNNNQNEHQQIASRKLKFFNDLEPLIADNKVDTLNTTCGQ